MPDEPGDFTTLLQRARAGDGGAEDALVELVYSELRAMAHRRMRSVPLSDTLQPTALVHEAYLRLVGRRGLEASGRRHFFALAARAMHDILVEQARRHATLVRGGGMQRVELGDRALDALASPAEFLAVSEAIGALRERDELAAEIVELRFFTGLTHEEVAQALELPVIRVRREWAFAKAFLHARLADGPRDDG